ncbi:uncharacterized protein YihR-like [Oscarella lobularis]|uniref:uncharacterized protein YihR-like n=1 Tax=Oscarella lobularis TaxID=121494 RepID=UPI003313E3A2
MEFHFISIVLLLFVPPISCSYEKEEAHGLLFEITNDEFGGLFLKVLRNKRTGEYVSIIYNFGGRVEDIVLLSPKTGKLRPVIWSHCRNATSVRENGSWRGEMLIPYANRISGGTYTFYGETYHLPINEPNRNNAIDGLIFNQTLAVVDQEADDKSATLTLRFVFDNVDPGYPFPLDMTLIYSLSDTGFSFKMIALNGDAHDPLPFYAGWHPYFLTTPYKTIVTFSNCTKWNHIDVTNNLIPTGTTELVEAFSDGLLIGGTADEPTYFDDGYKPLLGPSVCPMYETTLHDMSNGETIVLWQDSSFHYVQFYTGARTAFGVDAVVIVPMAGMTDCFNNHDGLIILSGNETWVGSFGVHLR